MPKFEKRQGWEGFVNGSFQKVYGFIRDHRGIHRVIQTITPENTIRYEMEIIDAPYDGKMHFHMELIPEPN